MGDELPMGSPIHQSLNGWQLSLIHHGKDNIPGDTIHTQDDHLQVASGSHFGHISQVDHFPALSLRGSCFSGTYHDEQVEDYHQADKDGYLVILTHSSHPFETVFLVKPRFILLRLLFSP